MAAKYDHLRAKAIELRTKHHMTLEDIVERLALPKTTIYYWIKDLPIPRTEKQTEAMRNKSNKIREKHAALRDQAYQEGLAELPELLEQKTFRDFVVMYMCEGSKRNRNRLSLVNSNPRMVKLAYEWLRRLSSNTNFYYALQYHADHDVDELKMYWADFLAIDPDLIRATRKSNSNQLSSRHFRSVHGLLTVEIWDTYLRARMQAWMDFIEREW